MKNNDFNLEYRRKKLYKKAFIRKICFRLSCILIFLISTSSLISKVFSKDENFIATIHMPPPETTDLFTICIDPGHGDFDPGAIGNNSTEKDIVLEVALLLGENLSHEKDIKLIFTRTSDELPWVKTANESLRDRITLADVSKSDLLISIHCNSKLNSTDTRGVETWYKTSNSNSRDFAQIIQNHLVEIDYTEDRGLKSHSTLEDSFAMVELPKATSVLVELGFLSNLSDETFLLSEIGQAACAKALAEAILEYKNTISE